ncbi:uncharacterized protein [Amphiura filiformis]|uniref:uncharacterized protein n=1 Tax=Amphiura filiformis TaxID=82378 RepID=UPI003B210E0F
MAAASRRCIFQLFLPIIRSSYRRNVICSVHPAYMLRTSYGRPLSFTAAVSSNAQKDTQVDPQVDVNAQIDVSEEAEESQISEMCDPYVEEQQPCLLCKVNIPVSFKNVQLLSQFVSPNTGRMMDRKITKLCHFQHRRVLREISIAKAFGLMPHMYRETVFLKDPSLYNIKYTGNPNIGSQVSLPPSTQDYEASKPAEVQTPMMAVKKKKKAFIPGGKSNVQKKKKK